MKESAEVKELRNKILGMEMELCLISRDLERFESDLLYNQQVIRSIEENVEFLRNSTAAVSLSEYKKIKQQQNLIETRIKYYIAKIQPLKQALGKKETFHKEEMQRFEEAYRMQFRNNVLEFPDDRRKEA